jgi:hypothetical protein
MGLLTVLGVFLLGASVGFLLGIIKSSAEISKLRSEIALLRTMEKSI